MPYIVTVCKSCDMLTDAPEHGLEDEYCEAPDGFERIELFTEREVARRLRDARGDDEAVSRSPMTLKADRIGEPMTADEEARLARSPQGEDHECGCGARKGEPCYLDADGPQYHALREVPAPQDGTHEIAARRAAHEAAQDWVDAAGGDEVDTGHVVDEALNAYLSRVSAPKADGNQEASQDDERRH